LIATLAEGWPAVFGQGATRPLRIGIDAEIHAGLGGGASKGLLSDVLRFWTSTDTYLAAVISLVQGATGSTAAMPARLPIMTAKWRGSSSRSGGPGGNLTGYACWMQPAKTELSDVLELLDRLFDLEVPRRPHPRPRLVQSDDRDPGGARLRAQLVRLGWDIWTDRGEIGLFDAMRAVLIARPSRQLWNRSMLSTLWADIGVPERPRNSA
jgi:hypothetical protein